ncbi:hypothetical protein HDU93_007782 [Gonapodya sp. JEL0774]|nr:hypothetical protein HDU93_007782 [Gonapodya sp. JEL0774]
MPTVKPPVEKIPLAARKNLRDSFESKKADFEAKLSGLLGTAWTVDVNANAILPYADEGEWNSVGDSIARYIEDAIDKLKYFLGKPQGELLKSELNTVCDKHVLSLAFDEEGKVPYYNATEIKDGVTRILFKEGKFNTNTQQSFDDLAKAVNVAPTPAGVTKPATSFATRVGIELEWTPKEAEIVAKLRELTGMSEFKVEPNWEETYAKMAASKTKPGDRDDWEGDLGSITRSYFEGLISNMSYKGFKTDDLLREGFAEGVDKGVAKFRIVDKISSGYNEVVLDGGVLYLQTTLEKWSTNTHYMGEKIVDLF